ncbi:MAG: alpha/beta hydrolase [Flavobacteriales bacterium]
MKTILKLISIYIKAISMISTELAVNEAFNIFQRPRKLKIRKHEQEFLDEHPPQSLSTPDGNVKYYELGDKQGPLVFLVHGWESNAASLSGIGEALVAEGFHVVSFDTPAHGLSEEKRANLMTMANHMRAVLRHFNPSTSFSVVAHSFGSITSSYALSKENYEIDQLVYLTSPMNLKDIFLEYKDRVKLSGSVYEGMVGKAESILGESLDEITMLKKTACISYQHLLLIHDQKDKMLPFKYSEELANKLPRTKLIALEGSGHYRMLWDARVINSITRTLCKSHVDVTS